MKSDFWTRVWLRVRHLWFFLCAYLASAFYGRKFPDSPPARLRLKYPDTFSGARLSFGEGWSELVDELAEKLLLVDSSVKVVQVKEKFGGLRFYLDRYPDEHYEEISALVSEYENKSYDTCEFCGSTEDVETKPTRNWVKTLCPDCRVEHWQQIQDQWGTVTEEPESVTEAKKKIANRN